ncbi:CinA-like protein [Propionigenium maris DSM 9537]|uniref:CinA-like protein n=1 Tax=Propionigenium maris DSM 9537 TaxID=1123000 RepID=A0A9W6GMF2_9FUSO|nr:competence/damage-inducible protein A [Propionigenium maris]GLI56391.1 CinA-like protein [Propionigenium maris DSM 9537]
MEASIILVGTELLNGMTVDTNSVYMAEELNKYGLEIVYKSTVRDNIEEIREAIEFAKKRTKLVILSGGLGPTMDDLTKEAVAGYLGLDLVVDPEEYRELERKFEERGIKLLPNNKKEVEKPVGAVSFKNDVGMAPAIYIDGIAAFPGVPRELYNMFPKFLEYYVKEEGIDDEMVIRDLLVWGIPESHLDDTLKDIFVEEDIHYEFLVKDYGIIVRLQSRNGMAHKIEGAAQEIYRRIGKNIFGEGHERLETRVTEELIRKDYTISLAESCTGGAVAAKLIDVPGVSQVLTEGIVCYSNEAKVERLGVSQATLDRYGAVSEETAREMLAGLTTDVGIATTGIAGPGGGSLEKPVGTVYIGIKVRDEVYIKRYNFKGSRERVRKLTVMNALFKLLKILDTRGNI